MHCSDWNSGHPGHHSGGVPEVMAAQAAAQARLRPAANLGVPLPAVVQKNAR